MRVQVDVWALGVCMFQWACGVLPFPGTTAAEVFDSISTCQATLPPGAPCSPALADVIAQAPPPSSPPFFDAPAPLSSCLFPSLSPFLTACIRLCN